MTRVISPPPGPRYAEGVGQKFARRHGDRSQIVRQSFQIAFVLINLWIGVRFYQWVRHYETGGATPHVSRPPGVEGWLPIASLMNLKYWLVTGVVPDVHAAGMFLLLSFLAMSFLLRKSFCSWVCPVGSVSEWLWQGGKALFRRNLRLPRWADLPLRSLKYVLMGFFVFAVAGMSADDLRAFMTSPYGLVADVKMLDFFRRLSVTAAVILAAIVVLSVPIQNFWCRYLCPYGALLGLVSLVSPARIRRDPDTCIDCAKCAKACPSILPVDRLITVKSAECTACLACVSVCPVKDTLDLSVGRRWRIPGWAVGVGVAALFLIAVGYARWTGHWHTTLPESLLLDLVPRATDFGHPGM